MKRITISILTILLYSTSFAKTIQVKNSEELQHANTMAQPGDIVVLKNGLWKNVDIKLTCSGTEAQPIYFKAETAGKVIITGISSLKLGGNYLVVDGLLFQNGYSPSNSVIHFRIDNKQLANNCRVTNCVINNFNKLKRLADDQWIAFYGKNNRLDHCSFYNKKNIGVLLAVLLDDERSRENFHAIDHNYFGVRLPLASNGGEIIRVGLSQHALFNSNTNIRDNFFEDCDGEAEIISIKSCSNVISNNTFKECQGSVVLRHGDNNTVVNNLFLGNGKEATGGVRIINKGQWVINNFFYQCRGQSFRAPLTIMNGVPNSPPTRYVQVTDAVVMNNTFVDCAPISLGEGSDAERTAKPEHVLFASNVFYNEVDNSVYRAWDRIDGILFSNNKLSNRITQQLVAGFEKTKLRSSEQHSMTIPIVEKNTDTKFADSLKTVDKQRWSVASSANSLSDADVLKQLATNTQGAKWFQPATKQQPALTIKCKTASEVYAAIGKHATPLVIRLTGNDYLFEKPVVIHNEVEIRADKNKSIRIRTHETVEALFVIGGGASLNFKGIRIDGDGLKASSFIATDSSGMVDHFNLVIDDVHLSHLSACSNIFYAHKSTLADSIIIRNTVINQFSNGFVLADEKDDKGYYNVEKLIITNNKFSNGNGMLLSLYRGGTDESTLGPNLNFSNNQIEDCTTQSAQQAIIQLTGIQKTKISGNKFLRSNASGNLISYKDTVRAEHFLSANQITDSGAVQKNQFVRE